MRGLTHRHVATAAGDYRLRSAAVGLDALPSARGDLFKYPPPAALPSEDVECSTLDETLTVAATLVQVPGRPAPGPRGVGDEERVPQDLGSFCGAP